MRIRDTMINDATTYQSKKTATLMAVIDFFNNGIFVRSFVPYGKVRFKQLKKGSKVTVRGYASIYNYTASGKNLVMITLQCVSATIHRSKRKTTAEKLKKIIIESKEEKQIKETKLEQLGGITYEEIEM